VLFVWRSPLSLPMRGTGLVPHGLQITKKRIEPVGTLGESLDLGVRMWYTEIVLYRSLASVLRCNAVHLHHCTSNPHTIIRPGKNSSDNRRLRFGLTIYLVAGQWLKPSVE